MDDRVVSSPATIRVLNVLRYVLNLFICINSFAYHTDACAMVSNTCATFGQIEFYFILFFFCRHWVSKHFQDFEQDVTLRVQTIKFLESVTISPHLLPVEIRAASQLLRLLSREDMEQNQTKLQLLLTPPNVCRHSYYYLLTLDYLLY